MVETEKQLIYYFFEIVASILIGVFVGLSYGQWEGILAGGIVLFASMIINGIVYYEDLAIEPVIVFGLVSIIIISLGSYFTFGMESAIIAVVAILIVIFVLVSSAKEWFT